MYLLKPFSPLSENYHSNADITIILLGGKKSHERIFILFYKKFANGVGAAGGFSDSQHYRYIANKKNEQEVIHEEQSLP